MTRQGSLCHGSFILWVRSACRSTRDATCTLFEFQHPKEAGQRSGVRATVRSNGKDVGCGGHGLGTGVDTHLLIVSESPITQRCRLGRVMATAMLSSALHQKRSLCRWGFNARILCPGRDWHTVDVPLSRLFSPRKPTSCSALLRTVLTMTASFSLPWNPSTDPSSMPGYSSLSIPASNAS